MTMIEVYTVLAEAYLNGCQQRLDSFHLQVKSAQLGLKATFFVKLVYYISIISRLDTEVTHQNATTDRLRVIWRSDFH